jgi:hypothetical protein
MCQLPQKCRICFSRKHHALGAFERPPARTHQAGRRSPPPRTSIETRMAPRYGAGPVGPTTNRAAIPTRAAIPIARSRELPRVPFVKRAREAEADHRRAPPPTCHRRRAALPGARAAELPGTRARGGSTTFVRRPNRAPPPPPSYRVDPNRRASAPTRALRSIAAALDLSVIGRPQLVASRTARVVTTPKPVTRVRRFNG